MTHLLINRLEKSVKWAQNRLSKKQFIIFSSMLIGLSAGFAAILLKTFVHYIFLAATYEKLSDYRFLYLLLPMIGLFLTVFVVKKVLKNKLVKGLSQVHYAIAKKASILPKNQTYDQVLTSSITVGFGGSTGLEAPIVITGAALGSNFSRKFKLSSKERTLLLACGVAAGIGAAFNAPIAGVLFTLEVLLLDLTISAFTPLIISAAAGALISKIILDDDILLSFRLEHSFDYINVPFYVLLGVIAGLVSVYHARMFTRIDLLFRYKSSGKYKKVVIGGLALALLISVFPTLFGEGYQSIKSLATNHPERILENSLFEKFKSSEWFVLIFIGVLVFVKSLATGLTLGAGGNGGNFAPALFVGAYLGFFFSKVFNLLFHSNLPVNNFSIVSMAGILSGLYHAPLTAIFLIAEITGGYSLMIPLMIVSSISFAISRYFDPYSMDVKNIAENGDALTSDRDKNVLAAINTVDYIENDYPTLSPSSSLGNLVEVVSNSTRNVFPVIDAENLLIGIIWLDDIRDTMFRLEQYEIISVSDLMVIPSILVDQSDTMDIVMKKFDKSNQWILPVVNEGIYQGFISKSNIFTGYRDKLKFSSID